VGHTQAPHRLVCRWYPSLIHSFNNPPESGKWVQMLHPYPLLVYVVLLSLVHICGLDLFLFRALVCDLLPRRLFHSSPKAHCQKNISVTILTKTAWRTLGLLGAFPIRARGGKGAFFSPKLPRATGSPPNPGRISFFLHFFVLCVFDLRPPQVRDFATCDGRVVKSRNLLRLNGRVASRLIADLQPPQFGKMEGKTTSERERTPLQKINVKMYDINIKSHFWSF